MMDALSLTYEDVVFIGEALDESAISSLPSELVSVLRQVNGCIVGKGAFHLRGVVTEPLWHSLFHVWMSEGALHEQYQCMRPSDVPFGQDVLGDQYLLRDGVVWRLWAETDEAECLDCSLLEFLSHVSASAVTTLELGVFEHYLQQGGRLLPGELLNVYPPFCTEQASQGVTLQAVPTLERLAFLATFSRQINQLEDGAQIEIRVT